MGNFVFYFVCIKKEPILSSKFFKTACLPQLEIVWQKASSCLCACTWGLLVLVSIACSSVVAEKSRHRKSNLEDRFGLTYICT